MRRGPRVVSEGGSVPCFICIAHTRPISRILRAQHVTSCEQQHSLTVIIIIILREKLRQDLLEWINLEYFRLVLQEEKY